MKQLTLAMLMGFAFTLQAQNTAFELVKDDDNIWVEKFDSTVVDENRYNWNNTIFKVGRTFVYDFVHITKTGDSLFVAFKEEQEWDFVSKSEKVDNTVAGVKIGVSNGLSPFDQFLPDYNQTVISYTYGKEKTFSVSGAIENEKNIWIHPPRDRYFKILELNPFPYIEAPYEVGTRWKWNLAIGAQWGDSRWKTWEGNIENSYDYEIVGTETIKTAFGEISCYVIQSHADSSLGKTALTAHFNESYGFVKLDYTNIDGSKTILQLIDLLAP